MEDWYLEDNSLQSQKGMQSKRIISVQWEGRENLRSEPMAKSWPSGQAEVKSIQAETPGEAAGRQGCSGEEAEGEQ